MYPREKRTVFGVFTHNGMSPVLYELVQRLAGAELKEISPLFPVYWQTAISVYSARNRQQSKGQGRN